MVTPRNVAYAPRVAFKLLPSKLFTWTPMVVPVMEPPSTSTSALSGTFQTVTPSEPMYCSACALIVFDMTRVLPMPAVMLMTWIPRQVVAAPISLMLSTAVIVLSATCHGDTRCELSNTPIARAAIVLSRIPYAAFVGLTTRILLVWTPTRTFCITLFTIDT